MLPPVSFYPGLNCVGRYVRSNYSCSDLITFSVTAIDTRTRISMMWCRVGLEHGTVQCAHFSQFMPRSLYQLIVNWPYGLCQIYWIYAIFNILLVPPYISSEENVLGYALSRILNCDSEVCHQTYSSIRHNELCCNGYLSIISQV